MPPTSTGGPVPLAHPVLEEAVEKTCAIKVSAICTHMQLMGMLTLTHEFLLLKTKVYLLPKKLLELYFKYFEEAI